MKIYRQYIIGNPGLVRDSDDDPWLLIDGTVYDPTTYVRNDNPPNIEKLSIERNGTIVTLPYHDLLMSFRSKLGDISDDLID